MNAPGPRISNSSSHRSISESKCLWLIGSDVNFLEMAFPNAEDSRYSSQSVIPRNRNAFSSIISFEIIFAKKWIKEQSDAIKGIDYIISSNHHQSFMYEISVTYWDRDRYACYALSTSGDKCSCPFFNASLRCFDRNRLPGESLYIHISICSKIAAVCAPAPVVFPFRAIYVCLFSFQTT